MRGGPCYAWSYWAIFRHQVLLAATIKEYKETRIIITWFYIVSVSIFLLKKESWVKWAYITSFVILENKRSRGRAASGWVHLLILRYQKGPRSFPSVHSVSISMSACPLRLVLLRVLRWLLQFQATYKDDNNQSQKCLLLHIYFTQKHCPPQRLSIHSHWPKLPRSITRRVIIIIGISGVDYSRFTSPSRLRETPTFPKAHGHPIFQKNEGVTSKKQGSENDREVRSLECLPHIPNKNRNRAQLTVHILMHRAGTNGLPGRQYHAYKIGHCCYNSMSSQGAANLSLKGTKWL